MAKLSRTEIKDLYKERSVLEEEYYNLTYLGENGIPYSEFVKRGDELLEKMSAIGKELEANGEEF